MNVTLLYFEDCPNWLVANERLEVVLADYPNASMTRHLVNTVDEAERTGFHGSPSILINGVDHFADPGDPVGLACRVYQTPDGPAGSPTLEQLRHALEGNSSG